MSRLILALALLAPTMAHSQEHRHPQGDAALHDAFYSKWMRPDDRSKSCCSKQDCRPARAYFDRERRKWIAWSVVRSQWMEIPERIIERERDVPTGPHLCENTSGLLCFGVGNGT
jgi:hypothetical protein